MPKFARKQTAPIDAVQFEGGLTTEVAEFIGDCTDALPPENGKHCWDEPSMTLRLWNSEEKQHIKVPAGHWIIKGLNSEFYPCSPEVFEASYEKAQGHA